MKNSDIEKTSKELSYYRNLVRCINHDELNNELEELKPYLDNIKILFHNANLDNENISHNYAYLSKYIDECINFAKALRDIKLNQKVIDTINIISNYSLTCDQMVLYLERLYVPEYFVDDLSDYLFTIKRMFMYSSRCWSKDNIDTGYELMDDVFKTFREYRETISNGLLFEDYVHGKNLTILTAIIAALNYYKGNPNLESFNYYFNHLDYYIDKMHMNGISEFNLNIYSNTVTNNKLFNNFEVLFGKNNILIK